MVKINPPEHLYAGMPCSFVAVNVARQLNNHGVTFYLTSLPEGLREKDGYLTLNGCNKYVRQHFKVKRRKDFKRGERPRLKDLHLEAKAIVVVYGHCIYLDNETYYSFFDNENDEVVAYWELDGEAIK